MGETQNGPFELPFNALLNIDFLGSWVTSDGGLIPARELDECLGLSYLIAQNIIDSRRGEKTQVSKSRR